MTSRQMGRIGLSTRTKILIGLFAILLLPVSASAAVILWEMDCLGIVQLTPISGGNHVVCEEIPTVTPTLAPTVTLTLTATSTLMPTTTPDPPAGGGLVLHYDARLGTLQDTGGPPSNIGDPVGEWQDQSGGEFHLIDRSIGRRPTLITGPFVEFDGENGVLYDGISLAQADEGTVIMLFRMTNPGDSPEPTLLRIQASTDAVNNQGAVSGGLQRIAWSYAISDGTFRFNYRTPGVNAYSKDFTIIGPDGAWHIVSMAWSANEGKFVVRIDQALFETVTGLIPWTGVTDNVTLGAKIRGGAHRIGADVAEMRVYDGKLAETEIATIENAIVSDWGLP